MICSIFLKCCLLDNIFHNFLPCIQTNNRLICNSLMYIPWAGEKIGDNSSLCKWFSKCKVIIDGKINFMLTSNISFAASSYAMVLTKMYPWKNPRKIFFNKIPCRFSSWTISSSNGNNCISCWFQLHESFFCSVDERRWLIEWFKVTMSILPCFISLGLCPWDIFNFMPLMISKIVIVDIMWWFSRKNIEDTRKWWYNCLINIYGNSDALFDSFSHIFYQIVVFLYCHIFSKITNKSSFL